MTAPAPAGMPSADAIADEIQRYIPTFHGANEAARAVLALFAPILAEKERETKDALREVIKHAAEAGEAKGKLLAAEAALAAERDRCAQIAVRIAQENLGDEVGYEIAAAIRAQSA